MVISDYKLLEKIIKPYRMSNLYHFDSVDGFSIDSRTIKKGQAFVAIAGKHFDGHNFIEQAVRRKASLIIAQRPVLLKKRVPFFLVDDTYQSLRLICRFIRETKKPFVYAITGSLGKSTTKEMLAFLLKPYCSLISTYKNENNLLGVAKTILSLDREKVMVLELGTNSPGEINDLSGICRPDAGVVTFIKPSHLHGLGSLKGVLREKTDFLKNNKKIIPVLNRDDPYLAKIKLSRKIFWIGKNKRNAFYAEKLGDSAGMSTFLINGRYRLRLPLHQEYFITNALLALTAASLLKLPLEKLVKRLNFFENSLDGRLQMQKHRGLYILNDSYNANPYSCVCSIRSLKKYQGKKIAVLADMLELGARSGRYHIALAQEVIDNGFDYCLTLGNYSQLLRQRLSELGFKNAHHFLSHKDVARFIRSQVLSSKNDPQKWLILLKGSRSMALEKVMDYL
jgi:UDP-N-acetylmuramoyl-tripeptide--D-alanyl-D-alanine ligase